MKQFLKSIWTILPYAIIVLTVAFVSIYVFKTFDKNIRTFDSIATGIIGGVITSVLIFVFQILWKKNINVWFENLLYQDVCIEGEWTGYLIPHLGIKDLDRIQRQLAFKIMKDRIRKEKATNQTAKEKTDTTVVDTEAEILPNDNNTTPTDNGVKAEIVLHHPDKGEQKTDNDPQPQKKRTIVVETTMRIKPITVRFEIKRTGHKISGRLIEVSGVSQINSYSIDGVFKNLILSGTYDTFNKENMDRGAFSLMLVDNGKKLEGFFSVYNDDEHKITPLQCILKKQNKISDNQEIESN